MLGRVADDRDDHGGDEEVATGRLSRRRPRSSRRASRRRAPWRPSRRRGRRARDGTTSRASASSPVATCCWRCRRSEYHVDADVENEQRDRDRDRQIGERVAVRVAVPAGDREIRKRSVATRDQPERDEARRAGRSRPRPPTSSEKPSTSSRFPTTEPVSEPRTTSVSPSWTAKSAMISSGRVPEGRVQEAADARPRVLGCVLGRLADQPRERDQRERGEHELERRIEVRDVVEQDRRAARARADAVEDAARTMAAVPYPTAATA